ncbi:MAG TPA: hypothetical protein VEI02_02455 [Planctomycetota bacterium]|nr:hypothetical protein [Planctomycetota bacterium]
MKPEERHALMDAVRDVVESAGFEVFRLAVGQDRRIRLVLDHPTRKVSVEDVARTNVRLRRALAEHGFDMDAFALEVESPGADRPLLEPKHYRRFVGERVRLVRKSGDMRDRVLVGRLAAADDVGVRLEIPGREPLAIVWRDVSEARLDPELPFLKPEKGGRRP